MRRRQADGSEADGESDSESDSVAGRRQRSQGDNSDVQQTAAVTGDTLTDRHRSERHAYRQLTRETSSGAKF